MSEKNKNNQSQQTQSAHSVESLQTTLEMFYDFLYDRGIAKQICVGVDTVVKHFMEERLPKNT